MCCSLMVSSIAYAQVDVGVELRPRFEYKNGYRSIASEFSTPAVSFSQRSRMTLNYQSDQFQTRVSLQDARVWGDATSLGFYEAWLNYRFSSAFSMKLGRQELSYDDERILAKRFWRQDGFAYDALVFKHEKDSLRIDVGLGINNSADNAFGNIYEDPSLFKSLHYLYLKKTLTPSAYVSLLSIGLGYQPDNSETVYIRQTHGLNYFLKNPKWNVILTGQYQHGKNRGGQDISAYMLAVELARKMDKWTWGGGIDYFSGHDAQNPDADYQNREHSFETLEGAKFKYAGRLNLFRVYKKHLLGGGLVDPYLRIKHQLNKKNKLMFEAHFFQLENSIANPKAGLSGIAGVEPNFLDRGSYIGTEIDLTWDVKISENLKLRLLHAMMNPTETLELMQGLNRGEGRLSTYTVAMMTFNFKNTFK
ncbi:MAG: alginate export family protein [Chitinophagales bacterium]